MKDLSLLTWLTQLALSVAVPLGGCVLLGVWLYNRFDLGVWVIWLGAGVGLVFALDGLRVSLKALERLSRGKEKNHPTGFNDHD